ncbi:MAG: glycosyltransferase [Nitrospirae bacterium]|nr:MAG: glycosyltransferase [Nitrospirota bacterium]
MSVNSIILRKEVNEKIKEIGKADIVVGIPSYNNEQTIGHVVKAIQAGITKYFPDKKAVLVNSDGGSDDGTREVVEKSTIDLESFLIRHRVNFFQKIVTPYQGIPGKGSAFRTIFEIARSLNARACAVVDSDLRSITPEWIELLLRPILDKDFDYVSPYYHRHKYDGTITNTIVYPVTRALYGKRIRQPIGGDFGFSGRLAAFYLQKDVWETDVAKYGIDIWMTTTAVANGFKICQAFLGAKIHDPKDPGADLSSMLHQVINTVFTLMDEYYHVWKEIKGSEAVPTFGFVYSVGLEPVNVNLEGMLEKFKLGVKELVIIYEQFLSKEKLRFLVDLSIKRDNRKFIFPDDLWSEIMYDFAIAFHKNIMNRELLIKSLTPLYLGKVASFVARTWESTAEEVEQRLEELALSFEKNKNYLIERWSADTNENQNGR